MRLLFRWVPRLILCGIVLFVLIGVVAYFINKPPEPPSIEDAPWAIQTYSNDELRIPARVYYAASMELRGDTPVAIVYWDFDGKHYRKHGGEKVFPQNEYGNISITRREG